MTIMQRTRHGAVRATLCLCVALMLVGCASEGSSDGWRTAPPRPAAADIDLPPGFVSGTAQVNGTKLHYVRGGAGPAVILIHGFPQDWSEYRKLMPVLAQRFTVIAPDLRGIGRSATSIAGFEAANLAEDIRQLAVQQRLSRPYIVGHDVGGPVAYAYARLFPEALRGAMVIETPLPGLAGWEETKANPIVWHINFHLAPRTPETLITGRQEAYFREQFFNTGLIRKDAISSAEVARYAAAYASAEQLHAGLGFYRAAPANELFNKAQRNPTRVPLVLVGGAKSFAPLLPALAQDLKAHGVAEVVVETVPDAAHYLADENPGEIAALIGRYAAESKRTSDRQ